MSRSTTFLLLVGALVIAGCFITSQVAGRIVFREVVHEIVRQIFHHR